MFVCFFTSSGKACLFSTVAVHQTWPALRPWPAQQPAAPLFSYPEAVVSTPAFQMLPLLLPGPVLLLLLLGRVLWLEQAIWLVRGLLLLLLLGAGQLPSGEPFAAEGIRDTVLAEAFPEEDNQDSQDTDQEEGSLGTVPVVACPGEDIRGNQEIGLGEGNQDTVPGGACPEEGSQDSQGTDQGEGNQDTALGEVATVEVVVVQEERPLGVAVTQLGLGQGQQQQQQERGLICLHPTWEPGKKPQRRRKTWPGRQQGKERGNHLLLQPLASSVRPPASRVAMRRV